MKASLACLSMATLVFVLSLTGCAKNSPPVILNLIADDDTVYVCDVVRVTAEVNDPDSGDNLYFTWQTPDGGELSESYGEEANWTAPFFEGDYRIILTVSDSVSTPVSDTITVVALQNYFPVNEGYNRLFRGFYDGDTIYYRENIIKKEEMDGATVCWHMKRRYFHPDYQDTNYFEPHDTLLIYTGAGDSVIIYDPFVGETYLSLPLPLSKGKSWQTGEGGTGIVSEQETGNNAVHVEIQGGMVERDFWLAPSTGIIQTKEKVILNSMQGDTAEIVFILYYNT